MPEDMNDTIIVTQEIIDQWAHDVSGPVALHVKQKMIPVEGEEAIIFPPTYADIGYNVDTLSDGTKVATIDSVGSQANRMEPLFKIEPYSSLVPQIEIALHAKQENGEKHIEKRSLLDLAHRSADAVVYSCPTLAPQITSAFQSLRNRGNAGPLCRIAPTSLLFGVWDSRGGSGEKRPRLVRSVIRAWNVEVLHSAAQFNSVWKALNSDQQTELEKEAKAKKIKLSEKGFADAPAIFRKVGTSMMPEFRDGAPNPQRRVLGGVIPRGGIERDITVNLAALRGLQGADEEDTNGIRRYLLALALLAVTADTSLFLREGCNLRIEDEDVWEVVPRRGRPIACSFTPEFISETLPKYAAAAVERFKPDWPQELTHKFDLKEAKKLLARKDEEEQSAATGG